MAGPRSTPAPVSVAPAKPVALSVAGGKVIRGSVLRIAGNAAGIVCGIVTATLLLRHLGVSESGRYVTVMSLVAIAASVAENGLNVVSSRELALRARSERARLVANIVGQRLTVTPLALLAIVSFAAIAGYPTRMIVGTALAGCGALLMSVANAFLLPLVVELRNAGLAFIDFLRQAVTLAGVAILVLLGSRLTPFFAVQILVALAALSLVPRLAGRHAFVLPRVDRDEQRHLLRATLPMAAAIVLGQLYFRLVIVLMSLISSPRQTGYFGGSLRAMETLVNVPILVAGVALPLLATAARDDRARLRFGIQGLSEGAVIAGIFVILAGARSAEPVMALIGGSGFRPAGAVLRIQLAALLFIALYQIWSVSLIALGKQRQLILTNGLGLVGVGVLAAILVPAFGARGGAIASVLGDALLAGLIYWRLQRVTGGLSVTRGFLARVAAAAAIAAAALLLPGVPGPASSALAGIAFLVSAYLLGALPRQLRGALTLRPPKPSGA